MAKIIRILEYEGPIEWIEATLTNPTAGVPAQGERKFDGGASIRSGLVLWDNTAAAEPVAAASAAVGTEGAGVGTEGQQPENPLTIPPSPVTISRL